MLLFKHINTERTEHHNPGKGYIREEIILSLRGHNLMCDAEPHHLIILHGFSWFLISKQT